MPTPVVPLLGLNLPRAPTKSSTSMPCATNQPIISSGSKPTHVSRPTISIVTVHCSRSRAAAETTPYTRTDVGFRYRPAFDATKRGAAQAFSYFFLYNDAPVGWNYDPTSNNYYRTRYGKVAMDEVTQTQLSTQNVVVIQVKEAPIEGNPKSRIDQQVVGSGKGILYRDGLREEVTWNKASPEAPLIFLDSNGQEVLFTAGQIWISAVPDLANITES
jgi:hypothetical protein